jgi:hypothetical protein
MRNRREFHGNFLGKSMRNKGEFQENFMGKSFREYKFSLMEVHEE